MQTLIYSHSSSGKLEKLTFNSPKAASVHAYLENRPTNDLAFDYDFSTGGRGMILPLKYQYGRVTKMLAAIEIQSSDVKEQVAEFEEVMKNVRGAPDTKRDINLVLLVYGKAAEELADESIVAKVASKHKFKNIHVIRGNSEKNIEAALEWLKEPVAPKPKKAETPRSSWVSKVSEGFQSFKQIFVR
eukprot:m.9669 g.9669  ORF g.9669 m.9669 type:complete len:187 (-) comp7240_c0_seq1:114-674(-)